MKRALVLGGLIILLTGTWSAAAVTAIQPGSKVQLDYTLKIDGFEVESSQQRGPLSFVVGEAQLIPGLEKALAGMKVGASKTVTIPPEEAYGAVNPQMFREFDKSAFPEGTSIQPGMVIDVYIAEGQVAKGIIWQITDDKVVVNLNHPLAGKTLEFDVKVVSIN